MKKNQSKPVEVELTPNMRVWLCMDARQELLLKKGGYDRFPDKELTKALYAHPHFITAYKALARRGLTSNGILTPLGWKVACSLCEEVKRILLEMDVTKIQKKG